MRKILLMSGLSKGGGAERVLSILANDFSDNGYSVVFSSFYNNGYYPLNNKVMTFKSNIPKEFYEITK